MDCETYTEQALVGCSLYYYYLYPLLHSGEVQVKILRGGSYVGWAWIYLIIEAHATIGAIVANGDDGKKTFRNGCGGRQ